MGAVFEPGRSIGPFTLIELIATGPHGEVWVAQEARPERSRRIALKRLRWPALQEPARKREILDALQKAQRISHPNAAKLFGAQELGGELLLSMELIEGASLDRLIERGPMEPKLALWIAREVLRTLVDAEAQIGDAPPGLIHGKLTPHNVLLSRTGEVKLSDLITARVGERLRRAAGSPERSDLAAVGGLLHAMLCGEWVDAARELAPLRRARRELPEAVDLAILRARSTSRDDRFRDGPAFEAALARIFYADLGGDDGSHGQSALKRALAEVISEPPPPPVLANPRPKGRFTEALEARQEPVVPQPLTADDHDPSIPLQAISLAPPAPLLPQVVPLAPRILPLPLPQSSSSAPAFQPGGGSSLGINRQDRLALAVLWFTVGFITALLLVLAARAWGPRDDGTAAPRPVTHIPTATPRP